MLILFCTQRLEMRLVSNFFSICLSLFPFGIHIITPSFCVDDNSPFLNPSFDNLTIKTPPASQRQGYNFDIVFVCVLFYCVSQFSLPTQLSLQPLNVNSQVIARFL